MARIELFGKYDTAQEKMTYVLTDINNKVIRNIEEGVPFQAVPHGVWWVPQRMPNKHGLGDVLVCTSTDPVMKALVLYDGKHGLWADTCSAERKGVFVNWYTPIALEDLLMRYGFDPGQCLLTFRNTFDIMVTNYWKTGNREPFILTDGEITESRWSKFGEDLHKCEYDIKSANYLVKGGKDGGVMILRNGKQYDEKIMRIIRDRFRRVVDKG